MADAGWRVRARRDGGDNVVMTRPHGFVVYGQPYSPRPSISKFCLVHETMDDTILNKGEGGSRCELPQWMQASPEIHFEIGAGKLYAGG